MRTGSQILDSLHAEIAVVDSTGQIVDCNYKWRVTASVGRLREGSWNYLAECEAASNRGCTEAVAIAAGIKAVLCGELPFYLETYSCPFSGVHRWFQIAASPLEIGGRRHAAIMHVDVSGLQRDPLTGLANRAYFDAQLGYTIATAATSRQCTGLLVVDVDNLKPINDRCGHPAGDRALQAVAHKLMALAKDGAMVTRIGGDEFGIVLPVLPDPLSLTRIVARLGSRLSLSVITGHDQFATVSASIGRAYYPEHGENAPELYEAADRDLFRRKRIITVREASRQPAPF